jgi:hypothetical protein
MKGRTYRYFEGDVLYPFGYGLSYTKFNFSLPKLEKTNISKTEKTKVNITVRNNGEFDGWETVPEFGFNPFDVDEYDDSECQQAAQNILETIQQTNKPPHIYQEVSLDDFKDLDTQGYSQLTSQFEHLGFRYIGDLENKTVSQQQQIITAIRIMYNAQTKVVASFYYFMDNFFVEFTSKIDDKFIMTTNAIESGNDDDIEQLDTMYIPFANVDEVLQNHLNRIAIFDSLLHDIDSLDAYIQMENQMLTYKYNYLKSIGWITKDYLLKHSGGDEILSECVYKQIQLLLEDQK